MRRIFVGDIQGCLEPLDRLLAEIHFEAGSDQLFPVGDLVNKGPDSPGVLRRLRGLGARPVLGNHDFHWLKRGEFEDTADAVWLESQPIVRVFDDLIMVHAGLHPNWTEAELEHLTSDQIDFAINVRYCSAGGERPDVDWPVPGPPYAPWDDYYRGEKLVVFGHWARRGLCRTSKVIGLDSGCVYGRQLSAWIAEEDRIVQVAGQTSGE